MKVRKRILALLFCGILIGNILPVSAEEHIIETDELVEQADYGLQEEVGNKLKDEEKHEGTEDEFILEEGENEREVQKNDVEDTGEENIAENKQEDTLKASDDNLEELQRGAFDEEGMCGESVKWQYCKEDSLLVISGMGMMYNYMDVGTNVSPWKNCDYKSVIIENGVNSIGSYAFAAPYGENGSLIDIIIPNSMKEIGYGAFANCNALCSIIIPDSVTKIGGGFIGCQKLAEIKVGGKNQAYSSKEGVLFNKEQTTLIAYPAAKDGEKYIVPSTVKSIGMEAFSGSVKLKEPILPKGVEIGTKAFAGSNIENIEIPEGIKTMGVGSYPQGYTFLGCTQLKNVKLPNSLTSIGHREFAGCHSLDNLVIPDGVSEIGIEAFMDCVSLTSIIIPKSVTKIETIAFIYCIRLQEVVMKGDAPEVGSSIFGSGGNLVIKVPKGATGYDVSPWTDYKIVYVDEEPVRPSPVDGLKAAAAGKNKTSLSWSVSPKAEGYLIYAQKKGKYGYCGMTSSTLFIDKKALDSEYNFYWVFPYVKDSNGKMYPGGCTKYVYAKGITLAVQDLRASSQRGSVKLTWKVSAGAEGYLVYGKTAAGKYGYKGMTTKGVTYTDKNASKKEFNFYWVYPYHKDENGKMIVGGTPKYVYGKAK